MRITRGIEVNEETLSFDTIRDVCLGGEGHYLGSDQTLRVMQSEYIYPDFSDRSSPNSMGRKQQAGALAQGSRKKERNPWQPFPVPCE